MNVMTSATREQSRTDSHNFVDIIQSKENP